MLEVAKVEQQIHSALFINSNAGRRTSIALLDHIAILVDASEDTPESSACDIA